MLVRMFSEKSIVFLNMTTCHLGEGPLLCLYYFKSWNFGPYWIREEITTYFVGEEKDQGF